MERISCQSRIERVVVYAEGAVVTRRVSVPERLAPAQVAVVVPAVTLIAEPGSFRAKSSRAVVGVSTRVSHEAPFVAAPVVVDAEKLRAKEAELTRLQERYSEVLLRLERMRPQTGLHGRLRLDPQARMSDAIAVLALADALGDEIREKVAALSAERVAIAAARGAADFERHERRPDERHVAEREVTVTLGPGDEAGVSLELEYVVGAARWWPAYSIHLRERATQADFRVEAFVAQCTREDWTDVALSLSTADLTRSVSLPELPSLRLGKARPPKRAAFRPLPDDLPALFKAYDAAVSARPVVERRSLPSFDAPPTGDLDESEPEEDVDDVYEGGDRVFGGAPDGSAPLDAISYAEEAPSMARDEPSMMTAQSMPSPMAPPATRSEVAKKSAPLMSRQRAMDAPGVGGGGAARGGPAREAFGAAETAPMSPGDQWLEFDALVLPSPELGGRGHLTRGATVAEGGASQALGEIRSMSPHHLARDPRSTRGSFDYMFVGTGPATVRALARPQRVFLTRADAPVRMRFASVPRVVLEVHREVELTSALDMPLLGGPVDVYSEGALLTTTSVDHVDRGGVVRVGLGPEDRVRISRNARVDESNVGMLGGTTSVDHTVDIEVQSLLGFEATIEIFERVPITDDKAVEVELLDGGTRPEKWDQADRQQPIRGGYRYLVAVPAGGKRNVTHKYRVKLSSKLEINGGNRRE